jgi:hypothetical protein
MKYKSNLDDVMDGLVVKLKGIKNTSPILREIAVTLVASNQLRIHNEGKMPSGSKITYKRSRKTPKKGVYSESYAKIKSKKWHTSFVNLEMTGKLHKELRAAPIPGGWGVGFMTSYGGKLSENIEKMYGKVWGLSQLDKRAIKETMNREINKRLK